MGEYASYHGEHIKIGTCEDMYYLRFDQRRFVGFLTGNVDVQDEETVLGLRFRFPFPDEDNLEPGSFEDYDRSVCIPGAKIPEGVDHGNIQFTAKGYLCSIPCPESGAVLPVKVARNGSSGAVHLVRQKLLRDGRLVPILKCGGCGHLWRCEDQAEIEELAVLLRAAGDNRKRDSWTESGESGGHEFYHEIAARVLAGARIVLQELEPVA